MPLSTGAKVVVGVGLGAAGLIGLAALAKGSPPASQITVCIGSGPTCATSATLPDTGGPISVEGTVVGIADGTVITLMENGSPTDITTTVVNGAFSLTLTLPANETQSPITYSLSASA